ncbi:MAG: c-type cytochrome, partial [Candidatus Saccharimonas sp.]|nr:c-type cytochrome [Planctomycetaceae bacterium]
MPATDDYRYSPKMMHKVFCASAMLLLFTTVWMMWADYNDEWRTYQRQAFKYQAERIRERAIAEGAAPEHQAKVAEVNEKLKAANLDLEKRTKDEDSLKAAVRQASNNESNHLRALKDQRQRRDVARAEYNLAIRDNLVGDALSKREQAYKDAEAITQTMEVKFTELKFATVEAKAKLGEVTGQRDAAEKELKGEQTKIVLLHAALNKIEPETPLSRIKRDLMLLPIIDGFNSPEKIAQDWLPRLEFTLGGMGMVSRFDRCRTCHAMIDAVDDTVKTHVAGAFPHGPSADGKKTKDGKFPHPYSSHPRLDVYLGATSPHPLPKFGCTVCHEGQGSGTSFTNASHTPNDPAQAGNWAEHHKWFDNHFWERPMAPNRFEESSCIKCHVNVTELAVNPKFGPTAPKVARGHQLVQTYGCFGCHEIQGFEGTKIIGPDLRLEPSTPEEAAEIAKDPNQVAGKMQKVGPSLRHLASKADAGFVASWTEEPKRFRPTTRMPQFFKLDNQQDHYGQQYNPVEIAAMTHYLLGKSSGYEQLAPAEDYKPNAARGKEFFATKGCVNCHMHEAVPGLNMTFGPELSKVHAKLKAGNVGFNWLYTWVREPTRYHPRTKMPAQPLEAEKVGDS